jgi:MarR family transcriptional regulator, organic hydroperoxide resistance regulator
MTSDDLLPSERKVLERLGDMQLDFRAMAVVSNLFRASAAIRRHMEANVLAEDKLSWTSFVALWVLWVWGDMEAWELASAVGISRPTATGVLNTLEGRGLVERSRDGRDKRVVRVSLSGEGEKVITRLFPRFNKEEASITSRIEPADQETIASQLRALKRAVDKEG